MCACVCAFVSQQLHHSPDPLGPMTASTLPGVTVAEMFWIISLAPLVFLSCVHVNVNVCAHRRSGCEVLSLHSCIHKHKHTHTHTYLDCEGNVAKLKGDILPRGVRRSLLAAGLSQLHITHLSVLQWGDACWGQGGRAVRHGMRAQQTGAPTCVRPFAESPRRFEG